MWRVSFWISTMVLRVSFWISTMVLRVFFWSSTMVLRVFCCSSTMVRKVFCWILQVQLVKQQYVFTTCTDQLADYLHFFIFAMISDGDSFFKIMQHFRPADVAWNWFQVYRADFQLFHIILPELNPQMIISRTYYRPPCSCTQYTQLTYGWHTNMP